MGVTGTKVLQPAMGGIIYIDDAGIVVYSGTLLDVLINDYLALSTLVAVDIASGLTTLTPSIIDSLGAVYKYDATATDFVVVDTSDINGTPVALAADWEDTLWIVDDAGSVW